MISLPRKVHHLNFYFQKKSDVRSLLLVSRARYSTRNGINIPKKVLRNPVEILRAIESTIKTDFTATHYKYHDDPYLIPMSNLGKRTFAMAQEAGRKAAFWVRQENADLFQHKEADPDIKSFIPRVLYTENSQVNEENLKTAIKNCSVSDAVLIYKLLLKQNIEISLETLGGLLDLLCYFNHEDPLLEEFIEERWFKQSSRGKERQKKTWKDGLLSEEIFISIKDPTPAFYSSIIQGMAKYGQAERAWQLFEESQQKRFILSVDAYNSIIEITSFLKEEYQMRWSFLMEILMSMAVAKVKPNLRTLNVVLKTLSTMGSSKMVRQNVIKVLNEFKTLGIEPSLASWYYVLITFCKERGPTCPILYDIMNELQDKKVKIQDIKDTFFFATAMDVCHHHLADKDLASRVHKLLLQYNNYDLIGDSFKESIYYRHYVTLLCVTEPLDGFMEKVYYQLVPHIYVPEPSVMVEILKSVEANSAVEYLPKLWSDMIIFDHVHRENLIILVVNIMMDSQVKSPELVQKFSDIAWDIWERIENQTETRMQQLSITGDIISKMLTVILRNNDFEKACQVMSSINQSVVGELTFDALSLFVDHCIIRKAPNRAISGIQYAFDCGFENVEELVIKLNKALQLNEQHFESLSKIVNLDILRS